MNYRQWKKSYKKRYGCNPSKLIDRKKAELYKSVEKFGVRIEKINEILANVFQGLGEGLIRIADELCSKSVITNADRIRDMSDEELAEFLKKVSESCLAEAEHYPCRNEYCDGDSCLSIDILEWLKSPALER